MLTARVVLPQSTTRHLGMLLRPCIGQIELISHPRALSFAQVAAAILPENTTASATRAYDDSLRSEATNTGGSVMVAPETRWQKQWKDIEDKVMRSAFHPQAAICMSSMQSRSCVLPSGQGMCWGSRRHQRRRFI